MSLARRRRNDATQGLERAAIAHLGIQRCNEIVTLTLGRGPDQRGAKNQRLARRHQPIE